MTTRVDKFLYPALFITGIAVVLFSTFAIARVIGWGPGLVGNAGDIPAFDQDAPVAAVNALVGPRCPECGMIVSTGNNVILVRMADGSSRMIEQANPARWRAGERLIFIAGTGPPQP